MSLLHTYLTFLTFLILYLHSIFARDVQIELHSTWKQKISSSLVEIGELLNDEYECSTSSTQSSPAALTQPIPCYWAYLDQLCHHSKEIETFLQTPTNESQLALENLGLDISTSLLPSELNDLFISSYRLGSASPAVEFYESLSTENPCGGEAYVIKLPEGYIYCNLQDSPLSTRASVLIDESMEWDHIYPFTTAPPDTEARYILYGPPGTEKTCQFHRQLAVKLETKYVYRPALPGQTILESGRTVVGFGVFLDIKNMEYKNVNDAEGKPVLNEEELAAELKGSEEDVGGIYFSTLYKRLPKKANELKTLKDELLANPSGVDSTTELKLWNMIDLGVQTTQAIVQSTDPVMTMADILHNFPRHASKLSSSPVDASVKDSITAYSAMFGYGLPKNVLFVDGVRIDLAGGQFNIHDTISIIKAEVRNRLQLKKLGLSASGSDIVLKTAASVTSKSSSNALEITRIDVSKGGKYAIVFLNNLEKDPIYKRWPKSLRQLLQPAWSIHAIQRNLYTIVTVADLSTYEGNSLVYQMQVLLQQQYPLRLGLALVCESSRVDDKAISSEEICRLFSRASESYSVPAAINFVYKLSELMMSKFEAEMNEEGNAAVAVSDKFLHIDEVVNLWAEVVSSTKNSWSSNTAAYKTEAQDVLTNKLQQEYVTNATLYLTARGLPKNSFSLNGIVIDSHEMNSHLMSILGREQYILAMYVRNGALSDSSKSLFADILKNNAKTYSRYHPILEGTTALYLDSEEFKLINSDLVYLDNRCDVDEDPSKKLFNTSLVLVSVDNDNGIKSLLSIVEWFEGKLKSDSTSCARGDRHRLSIHVRPQTVYSFSRLYQVVIRLIQESLDSKQAFSILKEVLKKSIDGKSLESILDELENGELKSMMQNLQENGQCSQRNELVVESLQHLIPQGEQNTLIIYNGRIIDTSSDQALHSLDLEIFSGLEESRFSKGLSELLSNSLKVFPDSEGSLTFTSDDFVIVSCFVGKYSSSTSRTNIDTFFQNTEYSLSNLPPFAVQITTEEETEYNVQLFYSVDPLSIGGQRAAAVIRYIQHHLRIPQVILFAPKLDINSFPLQNFYRFISSSSLDDSYAGASGAFSKLPTQHILTVRLDVPEAWNVQSFKAIQDIDNLKCDSVRCGDDPAGSNPKLTYVAYKLKNLLYAGQCYEFTVGKRPTPPNGLQLMLSKAKSNELFSDTLVMQNFGYFQLQANPGLWELRLAPGRGSDLYELKADDIVKETLLVPIKSFLHSVSMVSVEKKAGKEHLNLLSDDSTADKDSNSDAAGSPSLWNSISGLWGGKSTDSKAVAASNDTIHIFSLATGHVYERLLRIMMLSVTKRTSAKVKFWLFEYYLSPSFKETVNAMMKEYNFEVGYVMYKWPEWLTQQTEKQRIIWGYKILFLDVLFPLNVKKVIYVDADQVVRADLKELWDMDLQGKPYAYTPFCSSRKETLGFQFWRQGYWADHLQGRPYHISALYVVDLQVFRRYAVGDKLRGVYDQLAKDPNSLANLDQDLPNYAQHVVPIFSLPQEWLWCESWCSEKSKEKAKTIDLCNNPLHKEPKLDMARRIVNGSLFKESWVQLDEEISTLLKREGVALI